MEPSIQPTNRSNNTLCAVTIFWLAPLVISLLGTSPAIEAQESTNYRFYVNAITGFTVLGESDLSGSSDSLSVDGDAEFDTGFMAGGALGFYVTESFHVAGEIMYRTNDLDNGDFGEVGNVKGGDFSSLVIGLNGYYDFPEFRIGASGGSVTPYAGLGLAYAQEIDIDLELAGGEQSFSGDELGFQAMLGTRYAWSTPWYASAELRYLDLGEVTMDREGGQGKVSADYDPITFMFGVGYRW